MKSEAIRSYLDTLAIQELELEIELAEAQADGYVVGKDNAKHQKQAAFYKEHLEYARALLAHAVRDIKAYEASIARMKQIANTPRQGAAPRINEELT